MKTEYKVEYFKCTFSMAKGFHQTLESMINKYAAEGWKLFDWKMSPMGEWCTIVFEQDREY